MEDTKQESPAAGVDTSAKLNGFKRLGFVTSRGSALLSEAERLYKSARSYAPPIVGECNLQRVEDLTAQVISKAAPIGDKLLHFADDQVDYVVLTASEQADRAKMLHESNMKTFRAATETYMTYVSKAGDYIAEKLSPGVKGVQSARDSLQAGIEKAREATDPDVAVKIAMDAWTKFAAYPPVSKLLTTADPATQVGLKTFYTMHDALVVMPLYKRAIEGAGMTIYFATTTFPYKLCARFLYPMVQPYAEIAYSKVSQSKVMNHLLDYWKPTVVTA